jgi:hypothetical protein
MAAQHPRLQLFEQMLHGEERCRFLRVEPQPREFDARRFAALCAREGIDVSSSGLGRHAPEGFNPRRDPEKRLDSGSLSGLTTL